MFTRFLVNVEISGRSVITRGTAAKLHYKKGSRLPYERLPLLLSV